MRFNLVNRVSYLLWENRCCGGRPNPPCWKDRSRPVCGRRVWRGTASSLMSLVWLSSLLMMMLLVESSSLLSTSFERGIRSVPYLENRQTLALRGLIFRYLWGGIQVHTLRINRRTMRTLETICKLELVLRQFVKDCKGCLQVDVTRSLKLLQYRYYFLLTFRNCTEQFTATK